VSHHLSGANRFGSGRQKWRMVQVTLLPRVFDPILVSNQVQPAYICLPSIKCAYDSYARF
jgi:hypothetical protein